MTRRQRRDYLIEVADDGLLTHDVGPWAADKYRRMGMYAEVFATGMKNLWNARLYLDLFSGPGYVRMRDSSKVVLGSPLIALSLPNPFDHYVFVDENEHAVAALRERTLRTGSDLDVRFMVGDANKRVADVLAELVGGGQRTLSFCFLDPYKLNIHFDTLRALAANRPMDFLILLALHVDANRNLDRYVRQESGTIDRFLGDRNWRERWASAEGGGQGIVPFLAGEYSARMASLGYIPMPLEQMVKIRTYEKRLPLYYLAFFSKHRRGVEFWQEVLRYSDEQLPLL